MTTPGQRRGLKGIPAQNRGPFIFFLCRRRSRFGESGSRTVSSFVFAPYALNIQCGKPWRLGCEDAWDREPGRARGLVGEGTQSSGWGEGGRFQTCHPCLGTAKGTVEVTLCPVPASSIAGCPLVRVPLSETNPSPADSSSPLESLSSCQAGRHGSLQDDVPPCSTAALWYHRS